MTRHRADCTRKEANTLLSKWAILRWAKKCSFQIY
nr:MAG TPA: hypothetical protein [Caudoviricetes sp.]